MPKNNAKKTKKKIDKKTPSKGLEDNAKKVQLKPGEGILSEDGQKRLERVDLLEVENLRLKAREHQVTAQKLHLEAEKMEFNTNLTVKALRQEAMASEQKAQGFKDEQSILFGKLSEKYGVDFKKSTYDDETGIILTLEETKK